MDAAGSDSADDSKADSHEYELVIGEDNTSDSTAVGSVSLAELVQSIKYPPLRPGRGALWMKDPSRVYLPESNAAELSLGQMKRVFQKMYGSPGKGNNKAWYYSKVIGKDVTEHKEKPRQKVQKWRKQVSECWRYMYGTSGKGAGGNATRINC